MSAAWALATRYATERPVDVGIARIAAIQHGVISLEQLVALGLSPSAVRSRVRSGRLHRVHRGVYAVGHPKLTQKGRWMAGVLACGDGAALSHRSAAHLAGLSSFSGPVEVTAKDRRGRRRPDLLVHSGARLRRQDVTEFDGIPCTTWARTIVDLAATRPSREVESRHDFWWPEHRVSVEVDGYGTHGTRQGFQRDRRRDRNLILNTDIALLRFDADEVKHQTKTVAQDVLAMLRKRAPR